MKISPFLFLAILIFVMPVNALDIPIADLHCVAHAVAPTGYSGDADILFYAGSDNDLVCYDTLGGTIGNGITDFPTDIAGVYSTKYWNYIILADGRTYKITNEIGTRGFADLVFSGDSRDAYLLGDFTTSTSYLTLSIFTDDNGDIFVSTGNDESLIKIDGTSLTSTTYIDKTNQNAMLPLTTSQPRSIYAIDTNSIVVAHGDAAFDIDVTRITGINTYSKIFENTIMHDAASWSYIAPLSNGNYIIGFSEYTDLTTTIIEYNGSATIGTIYSGNGYGSATYDGGNIVVKPSGIILYASPINDIVTTFTSISGAGGVYTEEEGTTPAEITYNSKSINAEYETYYNQTNVNFKWSLAIDDDFIDTYNSVYSEPIYNRYYWQIELFSPDDIFVNSYIIPTNWKYQSYTLGIFGKGDYVNSGNVDFNNIVGNGTYTVKIYELNRITGAKAFLDSDTFIILSQTNPSTSGSVTETTGESAAYNFLNSPYLVAIIVIGIVGFQFGRGRDGNINGTAMIVLIPLAVGLCCLMGILPMWILYVMVLCIIAFVAVKMSSGGS